MSLQVIAVGSDNLVRLDALQYASTGSYLNTATVTFTLKDANGSVVSSLQDVGMSYVAGTNGRYEGNIPNAASITENALYTLTITASDGTYKLYRSISCIGKTRSEW